MTIPTLYLDGLLLSAAAYPAGFSQSLLAALRPGQSGRVSTMFLALLALPFVVVALATWHVDSSLVRFRETSTGLMALAVVCAPLAVLVEFVIHALVARAATGRFPRGMSVDPFWQVKRRWFDGLLLGLIVAGEELFYRQIWFAVLIRSCGAPAAVALGVSSIFYGLNHMAFGTTTVISKGAVGLFLGGLYLLGSESLWPPIVAHALQNVLILNRAGGKNG